MIEKRRGRVATRLVVKPTRKEEMNEGREEANTRLKAFSLARLKVVIVLGRMKTR